MTFTVFLVLMALANSLKTKYNWFKSKSEITKDIVTYIALPLESLDTVSNPTNYNDSLKPLKKLSDYIILNEKYYNNLNSSVVKWALKMDSSFPVHRNFKLQHPGLVPVLFDSFPERVEKYTEIGNALLFMYKRSIYDKESLISSLTKLDDAQIEHLELIRVPILGISFHVNYLGFYSGFLLTILCILFYFSLLREKINLKITFKRGWTDLKHHHYYLYEYAAMLQVLSIPKKLFTFRRKSNKTYLLFSRVAMYFPLSIYFLLFLYDILTRDIGSQTNGIMTWFTIIFNSIFLCFITTYTVMFSKQWRDLDTLWDNQAYEFNLEYILEAIGEDQEKDLINLFPSKISDSDLYAVKYLWYSMVKKHLNSKKKNSLKYSEKLLAEFINNTFQKKFGTSDQSEEELVEKAWKPLREWFESKGRKNVGSNFRNTFCEMVNEISTRLSLEEQYTERPIPAQN